MKDVKERPTFRLDLSNTMDILNALAILSIVPDPTTMPPAPTTENQEQAIADILDRFGLTQSMGFVVKGSVASIRLTLMNTLEDEIEEALEAMDTETRAQMGLEFGTDDIAPTIARFLVIRCMTVCEAMDFFSLYPSKRDGDDEVISSLITGEHFDEVAYLIEKSRLESTSYRWYPARNLEMSVLGKTISPRKDESKLHALEPAFGGKLKIHVGPIIETPYRYVNNVVSLVTQIAYKHHADRMGGDNEQSS